MAPPACDFPEFDEKNSPTSTRHPLTLKKEIKPHPLAQPTPDDLAVAESSVEDTKSRLDPPPSPLSFAHALADGYTTPPTARRQWAGSMDGNCPNSVAPIAPQIYTNKPKPTVSTATATKSTLTNDAGVYCQAPFSQSDLELPIALAIGLFVLGAVTGSSLVYSFSKPVIVHAAA